MNCPHFRKTSYKIINQKTIKLIIMKNSILTFALAFVFTVSFLNVFSQEPNTESDKKEKQSLVWSSGWN